MRSIKLNDAIKEYEQFKKVINEISNNMPILDNFFKTLVELSNLGDGKVYHKNGYIFKNGLSYEEVKTLIVLSIKDLTKALNKALYCVPNYKAIIREAKINELTKELFI